MSSQTTIQSIPSLGGIGVTSSSFTTFLGPGFADALYYYPPIVGVFSRIDPNLIIFPPKDLSAQPEPPPTAADLLFAGAYEQASSMLRGELAQHPDDPERLRLLALARSARRDFDSASAIIFRVYKGDPGISVYPLDGASLIGSPLEMRRIVIGAVHHAQRTGSAKDWLLVSVLMQAEGREESARKMIRRAEALGLDVSIVDAWLGPQSP